MDWDQPGFAKLRAPNRQHGICQVYITQAQRKNFTQTHTAYSQQTQQNVICPFAERIVWRQTQAHVQQ
jgi:hypothetical protein